MVTGNDEWGCPQSVFGLLGEPSPGSVADYISGSSGS